ncbi:MAG: glycosyltransferase [Selenomonadaceae bacterium]|nr:glycosyltransferase [Selenomonadaceae bacterium]
MSNDKIPLVSVIIPMFNAAKFIPQTLESLLYQTMTDFEVVVIDDCSTDNSISVVKSFAKNFGGRLKIISLRKNSGNSGFPRNVGIQFARGKYIAFLDSDDLYTKTALEELSTLAEKFQAEVVHMDSWFVLWNAKKKYPNDPALIDPHELFNPNNYTVRQPGEKVSIFNQPTFDTNNIADRVRRWVNWNYNWATWLSFYRRDFLIANQIFFPGIAMTVDFLFTFFALCKAEKFLRVPNITYVVRPRAGSVSRENDRELDIEAFFHKRLSTIRDGFNEFEKFMDTVPFFDKNPSYRYAVLDSFFYHSIRYAKQLKKIYTQNPTFTLNEFIKKEFHPDDAPLAAYLFNTVNMYRLHITNLQREIAALKASK